MVRQIGILLFSGMALVACSEEKSPVLPVEEPAVVKTVPAPDFDARMQQLSQDYFALRPELATYFGVPDEKAGAGISSRLGEYSSAGEKRRRAGLKSILDELAGIDRNSLTPRQKISLQLVEIEAGNAYAPATLVDYGSVLGEYGVWFVPWVVSHLTGPQIEIPAILEDKMAVETRADAVAYLSRLNRYAGVLDEVIEKIHHDRDLGVVPPDFSIDKAITNLAVNVDMPAVENSLVVRFGEKLTDSGIADADAFMEQAVALVDEQVYPASRRLIEALTALRPMATHEPGVGRLPNGEALPGDDHPHDRHDTGSRRNPCGRAGRGETHPRRDGSVAQHHRLYRGHRGCADE